MAQTTQNSPLAFSSKRVFSHLRFLTGLDPISYISRLVILAFFVIFFGVPVLWLFINKRFLIHTFSRRVIWFFEHPRRMLLRIDIFFGNRKIIFILKLNIHLLEDLVNDLLSPKDGTGPLSDTNGISGSKTINYEKRLFDMNRYGINSIIIKVIYCNFFVVECTFYYII